MDGPSQVTPEALRAAVAEDIQRMLETVSAAVGQAPDGRGSRLRRSGYVTRWRRCVSRFSRRRCS